MSQQCAANQHGNHAGHHHHAHGHAHGHGHGHGHEHGHNHGQAPQCECAHKPKSMGDYNKEHFDGVASTAFSVPWIAKLCKQVTEELRDNFAWLDLRKDSSGQLAQDVKMLDYACGDGTASQALASLVPRIRGIDISPGMVTQYNLRAEKEGFSREKMYAINASIGDDSTPSSELDSSEFNEFDLVVISLALHHVPNPDKMISLLSQRLRDGGVLVVVDWVDASESNCSQLSPDDTPVKQMISRGGFTEGEMKDWYEKAGLSGWGWKWFSSTSHVEGVEGEKMQAFISRGVKRGNDGEARL